MRRNQLSLVILSLVSMLFLASFQNCDRLKAFGNGDPYEGFGSSTAAYSQGQVTSGNQPGTGDPQNTQTLVCEPETPTDAVRSAVISSNLLSVRSWFNGVTGTTHIPWDSSTNNYEKLTSLDNGLFLQKFTLSSNRTAEVFYTDSVSEYHQILICK